MPRTQRVVDHIVEHLAEIEIDHIFGVDGANIEDLYDAAHFSSDITAVLAKHEFSAATMADGYSRSRRWFGGSGGDVWRWRTQSHSGPWGIIGQPGPGVGIGGSACDHDGRSRQLSRHQWPQRLTERRSVVFCGVGLLPAGVDARRHRFGVAGRYSGGTNRWPSSIVAAQGYSAVEGRCERLRQT